MSNEENSSLVREGQLFRQGYDAYCLPGGITKAEYRPYYSQDAQRVMIALLKPVRMQCISAKKLGNKEFGTRNDDASSLRNK